MECHVMVVKNGGEIVSDFLISEGVPYVFGVCGHGNVGLLDALYDRTDKIKVISPRHEQTAGHMADAYFRIKHEPVATFSSCGPGSANLVMPIANAYADSSAIFAISANIPTQQFNRGPFQEIYRQKEADFPSVLRPVVKRTYQPTRTEMLPLTLRQAYDVMLGGRPGPVHVDIPFNLFMEEADVEMETSQSNRTPRRSGADPEDVKAILKTLVAAEKPVIFIGHGVTLSEASAELVELAEHMNIPVISSPNGMGCIDMNHELSLGFIGRNGVYTANQAGRYCDVILCIGARFDDRSSSSWIPGYSWNIPGSTLIHVDVDVNEIGRNYPVNIGVVSDARTFLRQMLTEIAAQDIPRQEHKDWLENIKDWKGQWEKFVAPNFGIASSPMRPEAVVEGAAKVLPDNAIITLDSGVHHNWFMQFWKAKKPQSMLNAWGFSAMGFGVCGVLGAKLAAPDRPCISFCGDGGFTMTPHVLCTAVEYNIPVVWVIWNNFVWGAIRDIQHGLFDGREIGTAFTAGPNGEPYNPDFAAMARAHGVEALTVTHSDEYEAALEQAIASNKPFLLDVHVDANIRPPATGTWQLPPLAPKEPVFGGPYTP